MRPRFGESARLWVPLVSGCLSLIAVAARASDGREPASLSYNAAPECPSGQAFRNEVNARTKRVVWANTAEAAAHRVEVTLVIENGRFQGRLQIENLASGSDARRISGRTCDEVVAALALVAALAFDPNASTSNTEPSVGIATGSTDTTAMRGVDSDKAHASAVDSGNRPANGANAPPRPWQGIQPGSSSAVAPAQPNAASRVPQWVRNDPFTKPGPATDSPHRSQWSFGLQDSLIAGVFPSIADAGSVFVAASRRAALWGPELRLILSGAYSGWKTNAVGVGESRFYWISGMLEGCPLKIALSDALNALPCATAEYAWLHGQGRGVNSNETGLSRWLAPGGLARLQWSSEQGLLLGLHVAASFPLTRDSFVFRTPGRTEVHSVPAIIGQLGIGVGYRFP